MKKTILVLCVLVLLPSVMAISGGQQEEPGKSPMETVAGFGWQRYSGSSIRVFATNDGTHIKGVQGLISEFESLTGIDVEVEVLDYTSFRSRAPIELIGKSTTYDVMQSMPVVEGRKFHAAGWYEDLSKYLNDPNMTNPDFDWDDFFAAARAQASMGDDTIVIPYEAQTIHLWYRKDIFQQRGLDVPDTFDKLVDTAAKLHDPKNDFYGMSIRGASYQATTTFCPFLYGYGGSWLDEQGNPAIATKEAIDAFHFYGQLGSKYGPPGAAGINWSHTLEFMKQAKLGMAMEINIFISQLEDPSQSKVAGKMGYAMVPAGPAGPKPFFAGWAWMINPYSNNKGAAWYFIQYMASKEVFHDLQVLGHPTPRTSAWTSPEFAQADKKLNLKEITLKSYLAAEGVDMNPQVIPGLEARKIVGFVTDLALTGASRVEIEKATRNAVAEMEQLLAKYSKD